MDPVSLALSVVSVIGLFSAVFDVYAKLGALRGMERDLEEQFERLVHEMERIKFVTKGRSEISPSQDCHLLVKLTIDEIDRQLKGIIEALKTHAPELREHFALLVPGDRNTWPVLSNTTTSQRNSTSTKKRKGSFKWVASGGNDLHRRINMLHSSVDSLLLASMAEPRRARNHFLLRAEAIRQPDNAVDVLGTYPSILRAARVRQLIRPVHPVPTEQPYQAVHQLYIVDIRWHKPGGVNAAISTAWATGGLGVRNEPVLVEWRDPFLCGGLSGPAAERRLDSLCQLLRAVHEADTNVEEDEEVDSGRSVGFAQLECVGWTLATEQSLARIGVVFRWPSHSRPGGARGSMVQPQTLRDRMEASRRLRNSPIPPLGERFDLAWGVVCAMGNFITVGWMHRSIRSENMISFGTTASKLYLVGFTYARPGDRSPAAEFSELPQGKDWDFYRPPASTISNTQRGTDRFFDDLGSEEESSMTAPKLTTALPGSPAHDLYSLGIVLLEIGRWAPARSMTKDGSLKEFHERGLDQQVDKVASVCGNIYQGVVRRCLDPANWKNENTIENLADILESLKCCRA